MKNYFCITFIKIIERAGFVTPQKVQGETWRNNHKLKKCRHNLLPPVPDISRAQKKQNRLTTTKSSSHLQEVRQFRFNNNWSTKIIKKMKSKKSEQLLTTICMNKKQKSTSVLHMKFSQVVG